MSDSTFLELAQVDTDVEALVVGAGFAGIYQIHLLRRRGLNAVCVEAAPGIGGAWYWNAYPGARCDVESLDYSYGFDEQLEQEWDWTERYAAQPEILAHLDHVVDRFALAPYIALDAPVRFATWDEASHRWQVNVGDRRINSRFLVMATGSLSAPVDPPFPGHEDFLGESYQTARFPHDGVDFAGKRVAIIGTGSSGVQAAPVVAESAAALTVFQRTANFTVPGRNRPLLGGEIEVRKSYYREYRGKQRASRAGIPLHTNDRTAAEMEPDERIAELEERWSYGGAPVFNVAFADVMTSDFANGIMSDFVRDRIRERVTDPELAEMLVPTGHPIWSKRLCVDHGYFEIYNHDHVRLVDVQRNPIGRVTPNGVLLRDGTEHEFDVLLYALGYDAVTGALTDIDIRGVDGRLLSDEWADGPHSLYGVAMAGFPNLLMVLGPCSPTILVVMPVAIEMCVEWIDRCVGYFYDRGLTRVEASAQAERSWTELVHEMAEGTVFTSGTNSYYVGANIPGKARVFPLYTGGLVGYGEAHEASAANGYLEFEADLHEPGARESVSSRQ